VTAALSIEERQFALDVLPAASLTGRRLVGLAHRADDLKDFLAILTDIFVNGHGNLVHQINFVTILLLFLFDAQLLPVEIRRVLSPGFGIPFEDRIGRLVLGQPGFGAGDQFKKRRVAPIGQKFGLAFLRPRPGNGRL